MLLTYAIGDVHGRSNLLQAVITYCEEDAALRASSSSAILSIVAEMLRGVSKLWVVP